MEQEIISRWNRGEPLDVIARAVGLSRKAVLVVIGLVKEKV